MPIPTHLITGFLGVGKTTAIRQLLARRPENERWAVLVNEFGQVGVDEQLLEDKTVAIRQIPGGCLCCVASQAFTVGLNRLIREQRPERILIEPTGLGHPARVIETLTGEFYRDVLDLRAVITLMDARHLASPRHREHPNWQDQIRLADVLVANKADLYSDADREAFLSFAREMDPPKVLTALVDSGALDPAWLDLPRDPRRGALHPEAHQHHHDHPGECMPPATDWWRVAQQGDGYYGVSWLLGPKVRLDHQRLADWLQAQDLERIKGLLHTDRGWQGINRVAGEGGLTPRADAPEGRLEIIHNEPLDMEALDRALLNLRLS